MNRTYCLVWNRALRVLQVASELAHAPVTASDGTPSSRRTLAPRPLALACALALGGLLLGASPPAYADGGRGGYSGAGGGGTTNSTTGMASNGGNGTLGVNVGAGGGGGGAGITGGSGGTGSPEGEGTSGGAGGTGGSVAMNGIGGSGINGAAGGGFFGSGGGGGGGGAFGAITATFPLSYSTITGGNGGNGGDSNGGGGGGGAGGYGVFITGAGGTNTATINGGNGGKGGNSTIDFAQGAGNGGGGGTGVFFANGSNGTLINTGVITGGHGGMGGNGAGGYSGNSAAGGVGIVTTGGNSIINSNTISGGLDGSGSTRADAVLFGGTGNTLNLKTGSNLIGNLELANNAGATIAAQNSGMTLGNNIVLGGGSSLGFNGSTAGLTVSGVISGSGALQQVGGGTTVLTGNNSFSGGIVISAGTLQIGDGTANGAIGAGDVTDNGALVFENTASTTIANNITGIGTVTQQGTGLLTYIGTNTYNGATTIRAGTLALSGSGSIAGSSDVTVASNAAFDISNTTNGASIVSLDGASGSTVNLGTRTLTLTGASGTFAGQIIGNGGLTVSGGTETLNGFNSYTGATTINHGATLIDLTSVQALTTTNALNLDNGTLQLTNASLTTSAPVTLGAGGGTFNITPTGGSSRYLELDGLVSGNGSLTFTSNGQNTLTLTNGNNSYSGGTTINGAYRTAVSANSTGALGSGPVSVGGDGSSPTNILAFYGSATTPTSAGSLAITVNGTSDLNFGQYSSAGNATIDNHGAAATTNFYISSDAGNATINNTGQYGTIAFQGGNAGSAVISNVGQGLYTAKITFDDGYGGNGNPVASDLGSVSITNASGGTTYLSGHTDAGSAVLTNQVGGIIQFQASSTAAGAIVANGVGGEVDVLYRDATATNLSIGSLSGGGDVVLGSSYDANYNVVPITLTLGALNRDDVIDGVISDVDSGGASYGDALDKLGSGTLTLNGVNTYTGLTDVQAGTLIVGDSAHATASIAGDAQVDQGATLDGHGMIGGDVDVAGGAHLAPGDSIGTLTVGGNLSIAQDARLDFEFGAPGANLQTAGTGDSVKVGGSLELDGAVLNITDAGGFGPGLYNLFAYGGSLTETHGGISLGTAPGGLYTIQNLTADKQINLLNISSTVLNFWNANGLASATQMGGGSGTWTMASPNWTDAAGSVTAAMQPQPSFAIFGGAAGAVTVDDSAGNVDTTGLQFAGNGYALTGDTLTLVRTSGDAPVIRVGDGSAAGADYVATINNVLAGTDGLTKSDLGTLVLTASNTYSDGTTITGGTLSVARDANLGAASGDLTLDGGTLQVTGTAFNGTSRDIMLGSQGGGFDIADTGNTFTVTQALDGTGALVKRGTGTLLLTGANSYAGGTTIDAGTLRGDSTSLQGNIIDNAALTFDQHADGIFAGSLSGNGTLTKTGAGLLVFNGNNTFSGNTTVQAGTLEVGDANTVTAFLGGDVQVAAGGTLRGHGTIGGNLVNDGTLWPGGSIGTLTVHGNYTQNAHGVFNIDALPSGQTSQLVVGGKATILGGSTVVLAQAGNWAPRTDYTVLIATGGVSGQFASASASLPFLNPVLSYTANAVNLALQRNDISFASVAQTPNQRATAAVADGFGFGSAVYTALTTLDAPTARHAYDQLSGVIHASTRKALIDDSRYVRDAIDRHLLGLGHDVNEGATADGLSVWTSAWGHGGHDADDGNAATLQANGSGLLFGADLPLGNSRLGVVLGHGQNSTQSNSVGSSAHVLGNHASLYGSSAFGAFALRAGVAYAWQDVHSNRTVAFGNYSDRLTSQHHAQTAQAYVEGGYRFDVSLNQQLEPFVNLARVRVHDDALREGGGDAALALDGNSTSVNTATLGLRDTLALDAAAGIHAHASLGWQQAWGDLTPVSSMRFVAGGDSFAIAGMPVARHAVTTDLGIDFKLAKNVTVDASYLGQFASGVRDQGARMSLTVTF
ncbi:autotransporter-associated beta strand repeat-containing protein [Rhodanobacter sp. Col0626]|uniref:autotransporter-associated beta strand repeat-containing protein n=1 Tax=Rhodanobacter sp. Col0626 TaxID=3415679 RepID=UPI003CF40305